MKGIRLILAIILVVALIMRLYNFEKGFSFAHDQDLYSWIARDILINKHQRLIGQVTSVDGVFIGSFYYYLMAIAYFFSKMNPLSAVVPITIIGLFNVWSFYFVLNRHFGKKTGIWGAFIWAVSFGAAAFDRWSVPTQPTITWSIWFLFTILEAYGGNRSILVLYGFLAGFIWQIHIALLPIIPLPVLAYFVGDNLHKRLKAWEWKQIVLGITVFLLSISPFLLFEIKHNFSQTSAIISGSQKDMGGPSGYLKVQKTINASAREIQTRLIYGLDTFKPVEAVWWLILGCLIWIIIKNGKYRGKVILISLWPIMIMLVQYWSKRIVSEYYFTNIIPVIVTILAIILAQIKLKFVGLGIIVLYGFINFKWLAEKSDVDHSYFYRKQLVEAVKADMEVKKYPCIGVNFIADTGFSWGFRYLWWFNDVKVVKPTTPGVPIYNVFVPAGLGEKDGAVKYGRFGLLNAVNGNSVTKDDCEKDEYQLEPLLGYVE